MRLCVVGNSHAAALKGAVAIDETAANVRFDFFVMPGGLGPHIHADGHRLFVDARLLDKVFSTVPGAVADGLDLAAFDAVMICASGLPAHRNGSASHVLNQLALGAFTEASAGKRQRVSEAVMTLAIEAALHDAPNLAAIRTIRSIYSGPLLVQVCPLPTRALAAYRPASDTGSDLAVQYGDRVWPFLSWYYRHQIEIIDAFAASLSACVLAPDEDFVEAGFTPTKYRTPDPWHMNTAYGRLVLRQALAELAISSA